MKCHYVKSYGKADASWDDARFRRVIEDMLEITRRSTKNVFAVSQDLQGDVMVTEAGQDHRIDACVAYTSADGELRDNVEYSRYTVDEMIPRVRDVLTKGIVEYGRLLMMSEGRMQIRDAIRCAVCLNMIHGRPFVVGQSDRGRYNDGRPDGTIMVAPISERDRFVYHTSCVVTQSGYWSLPDRLPDTRAYHYLRLHDGSRIRDDADASDMRSVRPDDAMMLIYASILEHNNNECRCRH